VGGGFSSYEELSRDADAQLRGKNWLGLGDPLVIQHQADGRRKLANERSVGRDGRGHGSTAVTSIS